MEQRALFYHSLSRDIFQPSIELLSYFQNAEVSDWLREKGVSVKRQKEKKKREKDPNIGKSFLKFRDAIALLELFLLFGDLAHLLSNDVMVMELIISGEQVLNVRVRLSCHHAPLWKP